MLSNRWFKNSGESKKPAPVNRCRLFYHGGTFDVLTKRIALIDISRLKALSEPACTLL